MNRKSLKSSGESSKPNALAPLKVGRIAASLTAELELIPTEPGSVLTPEAVGALERIRGLAHELNESATQIESFAMVMSDFEGDDLLSY